jgi:hypothetical protein
VNEPEESEMLTPWHKDQGASLVKCIIFERRQAKRKHFPFKRELGKHFT